MKKRFLSFGSIGQYKEVIREISSAADYSGNDELGNPIYISQEKPILKVEGTIKLHGTNGGISYNPITGLFTQSRKQLLVGKDNYGFNAFVMANKEYFESTMINLHSKYCKEDEFITLFGEWAGQGILGGTAIAQLPKSFYVFDCRVHSETKEECIDIKDWSFHYENVMNIYNFPTFSLDIDFNNPALVQNKLGELTQEVEDECPVASKLGVKGIGEGIVWRVFWKGKRFIFKVKGQKHSVSKVKKLAPVNEEVLNSINAFVEYACTENRIEQGIAETNAADFKDISNVIRWIAKDIIKEENNALEANGLTWKQVAKPVANKTRNYFINKIRQV